MMKNHSPKVFISSTFYDLKQIRSDLSHFIENDLGFQFLKSEHSSFPVNPDIDTIQNCKEQVKNCDIMVLIIGGRYGSIPNDGIKSVTNIEYLTAKLSHKPIYIFVAKDILSILPIWEKSPNADFSSGVDNNELFNFVSSIKEESKWIFPFDTVQDIISILRTQFAYLMSRGISLINKMSEQTSIMDELSGKAFKIAVDKPVGWHALLFAELIKQEVDKRIEKKIVYALNINIGLGEYIRDENFQNWCLFKNDEAKRFIIGLTKIINESLKEALRAEDIYKLFHSTRIIGNAYEEAIDWALRIRKCYVSDKFKEFIEELSLILEDSIEKIEGISELITEKIEKAFLIPSDKSIVIELSVKLIIKNEKEWNKKFDSIKQYFP